MIKVLYFARLREQLGCGEETLPLLPGKVAAIKELVALLSDRGRIWGDTLSDPNVRVAVNQTIADLDTAINDGDEVAFFPPVTGG